MDNDAKEIQRRKYVLSRSRITLFYFENYIKINKNGPRLIFFNLSREMEFKKGFTADNSDVITAAHFNLICRICLSNDVNMVDIFLSGIDNQMMELTNLKISCEDQLPKTLCQKCSQQVNQLHGFVSRAKSSDGYLRSLLPIPNQTQRLGLKKSARKRPSTKSKHKGKKKKSSNEKLYIIVVPQKTEETEESAEDIRIKDLDRENYALSNFCQTVLDKKLFDHTYPKEDTTVKSAGHNSRLTEYVENFVIDEEDSGKMEDSDLIFKVNMSAYACNKCCECFDEFEEFASHASFYHGENSISLNTRFVCPVCCHQDSDKILFLNHLRTHERNGFAFMKINSKGEEVALSDGESDVFGREKQIVRVYKMCFDTDGQSQFRFPCPVCSESWIDDDDENFLLHLSTYENVIFVRVDSLGNPIGTDAAVFTPAEHFLDMIRSENALVVNDRRLWKIIETNACDECDFEATSFSFLEDHYASVHYADFPIPTSFLTCPVCGEHVLFETPDETRLRFHEHLRTHEKCIFLRTRRNGEILNPLEIFDGNFWRPEKFEETKYTCDMCSTSFARRREMIEHLKVHESKPNLDYVCEKCGRKCTGRANYNRHFLTHADDVKSTVKKPNCPVCGKTFANKHTLNEHFKQHESENSRARIICEVCGRTFSSNSSLTKHRKLHLTENGLLKCDLCDRYFSRQSSFDRHVAAHVNPNYFECETCRLPLPSEKSLNKHSESHRISSDTFDCKICKVSFLSKEGLIGHQSHTGHYHDREPFECNVCHEKFMMAKNFAQHIKTHPKYKMSECSLCGKKLATIQSLMLHMRRHFESNSILCPVCGKQFFEKKNYDRHFMIHRGVKPFSCDVAGCDKSFYTMFEIKRHKKYHDNTRDFACPHCSKSFHEANHLKVHVRMHTGERPYICPHCSKGFVTRTRCKQHIKLIHQGVGYDLIQSSIVKKVAVFETVEIAE